jgi:hypothetical protein
MARGVAFAPRCHGRADRGPNRRSRAPQCGGNRATLLPSVTSPTAQRGCAGLLRVSVDLRTPQMETAAVAQWKMVDEDDLLYFPTQYSVGLAVYVLVGHDASPDWSRPIPSTPAG